jgi:hypothetical protein
MGGVIMKLVENWLAKPGETKVVEYFGLHIAVPKETKFLTSDEYGCITAHFSTPLLRDGFFESDGNFDIARVDLDGASWIDAIFCCDELSAVQSVLSVINGGCEQYTLFDVACGLSARGMFDTPIGWPESIMDDFYKQPFTIDRQEELLRHLISEEEYRNF